MNKETTRKLTGSLTLIRIIFGGLLFGMASFLAAMSMIILPNSQQTASNEPFQLIAPIFLVIAVSTSIYLRRAMLAKVNTEPDPLKLIKAYTSTRIIQMGLLDAAIIFTIVCFVLTTNTYFMMLAGLGTLYFLTLFPLKNKMILQLRLHDITASINK